MAEPAELEIPPEMAEVLSALTDEGKREFIHEFFEAMSRAQKTNSLTPIQSVIDDWHRSMTMVHSIFARFGSVEALQEWESQALLEEPMDLEQVRKTLGV